MGRKGSEFENYDQYMQSPEWAAKKKACYEAWGGPTCALCGANATVCHHLNYTAAPYGQEDPKRDLMPLCAACHDRQHDREVATEQQERNISFKVDDVRDMVKCWHEGEMATGVTRSWRDSRVNLVVNVDIMRILSLGLQAFDDWQRWAEAPRSDQGMSTATCCLDYSPCPVCGGRKAATSLRCQDCHTKKRNPSDRVDRAPRPTSWDHITDDDLKEAISAVSTPANATFGQVAVELRRCGLISWEGA